MASLASPVVASLASQVEEVSQATAVAAAASLTNPVAVPAVASLVSVADLDPLAAASLENLVVEADAPAADLATMDTLPETVTEMDMETDMEATV